MRRVDTNLFHQHHEEVAYKLLIFNDLKICNLKNIILAGFLLQLDSAIYRLILFQRRQIVILYRCFTIYYTTLCRIPSGKHENFVLKRLFIKVVVVGTGCCQITHAGKEILNYQCLINRVCNASTCTCKLNLKFTNDIGH